MKNKFVHKKLESRSVLKSLFYFVKQIFLPFETFCLPRKVFAIIEQIFSNIQVNFLLFYLNMNEFDTYLSFFFVAEHGQSTVT